MITRENMTTKQVIERLKGIVTDARFIPVLMTDEREAIYKAIELLKPITKWYVVTSYYEDDTAASVIVSDKDFDSDWRPRSGKCKTYTQCVDVFEDLADAENFKRKIYQR